jgi:hypothetical protein
VCFTQAMKRKGRFSPQLASSNGVPLLSDRSTPLRIAVPKFPVTRQELIYPLLHSVDQPQPRMVMVKPARSFDLKVVIAIPLLRANGAKWRRPNWNSRSKLEHGTWTLVNSANNDERDFWQLFFLASTEYRRCWECVFQHMRMRLWSSESKLDSTLAAHSL